MTLEERLEAMQNTLVKILDVLAHPTVMSVDPYNTPTQPTPPVKKTKKAKKEIEKAQEPEEDDAGTLEVTEDIVRNIFRNILTHPNAGDPGKTKEKLINIIKSCGGSSLVDLTGEALVKCYNQALTTLHSLGNVGSGGDLDV